MTHSRRTGRHTTKVLRTKSSIAHARNVGTSSPSNYLQILEDAWQQHLAPCAENAPTVISTFAGAGGSSLGYSMAGFKELLAVEWDNNAVETFRLNFPDVPVYHGDIAKLNVDEVLNMTGLKVGELDVFDGSPPCQGFSTAGKRVLDDPRNQLFREYVRLLRGLQPKVFVMENVSGMVKGKMKLIFADILRELKASGYQVKACMLNAMYFHVPQSRQRMIFIGVRNDLGIEPSYPKAQSKPIGVQAAIGTFEGKMRSISIYCQWAKYLKVGQKSANVPNMPTKERDIFRIYPGKPVPTITKKSQNQLIHYKEDRPLSYPELSLCASFPSKFQWCGKENERIGNSVPPLFMRAIAQHIRSAILNS